MDWYCQSLGVLALHYIQGTCAVAILSGPSLDHGVSGTSPPSWLSLPVFATGMQAGWSHTLTFSSLSLLSPTTWHSAISSEVSLTSSLSVISFHFSHF